ncbi:MAG: PH domain-containing protein [Variibacter sp.]|nr:PH domain-containing protein [Variibacter sp.]
MRYVDSVLQPGETVRQVATLHWVVFLPGIATLVVALVIYLMIPNTGALSTIGTWLALLLLAGSLYLLARAWWRRASTEYAITDRRIIFKRGLVWRRTIEMNMDKVSSVDVRQSIVARLLNYGTVFVHGPGPDFEPIVDIDAPLEFRNHIVAR